MLEPNVVDEPLTAVESRLLCVASDLANRLKAEAEKGLAEQLAVIITAHGHTPTDGRNYTFVNEGGAFFLRSQ